MSMHSEAETNQDKPNGKGPQLAIGWQIFKAINALVLLFVGILLIWLSIRYAQLQVYALLPGLVCLVLSTVSVLSRSRVLILIAFLAGGCISVLFWAAVVILSYAAHSR